MIVSKNGQHCLLLTDHELFYNNYDSNQIIPIDKLLKESMKESTQLRAFKCIDIDQSGGEDA